MSKKVKLWKWQKGRQDGTEYMKFPLWYFRIGKWGFDAYILKYAPLTELKWHTDPVPQGEHWRKNITLKGFSSFLIEIDGEKITSNHDWPWFRPDLHPHMVVTYESGCTKLSFGFVKFNQES